MRGMIRLDRSVGKWIKTRWERLDKSDQGGYDRVGAIIVEKIKKIRVEREKCSEEGRTEQSEWIGSDKAVVERVNTERG